MKYTYSLRIIFQDCSVNIGSLFLAWVPCRNIGLIRIYPYWSSRENSLELCSISESVFSLYSTVAHKTMK